MKIDRYIMPFVIYYNLTLYIFSYSITSIITKFMANKLINIKLYINN